MSFWRDLKDVVSGEKVRDIGEEVTKNREARVELKKMVIEWGSIKGGRRRQIRKPAKGKQAKKVKRETQKKTVRQLKEEEELIDNELEALVIEHGQEEHAD